MDVLRRHLPRVAEALRSALEYLSAVATLVFGEPPPSTVSPQADSKTSPQPAEVDYDRAEEALWTVSLPDEANDHQAEDSFSCIKVSTDALDLSAPRSRVTLRRVLSAKRQSSAGSQTRSISKASLEESLTELLPDAQSSTEPPHGSIGEICLEDALQQASIHLEGLERPQHNGTEETSLEDSHAGVSTQNRSWEEPHYESTSEASLEESIWSQLACRQGSAVPQAGNIGETCPVESHVGLSNKQQRLAEPQPRDIDETCLKGSHEDLSSQSQRVSELQLGDIDEFCLAESHVVLSNEQQRSAEPQPVGDIDETCLKGSHEDLSTQSQRLSELQSGNIDDTCLVELIEDLHVQGQSSAGSLPGDVKNAPLEKESFHVDPARVSLSTFYYSITEPTAEWCPQTQEDDIDEKEVDDNVLNLTGDLLQEMKEYLQTPLMGSWAKDELSSTGNEVESQEEEENGQPQDMVNTERSRDWEVKESEEEEEKKGWPAETVQEKSGVEVGENEKENLHWRSATTTEAEGRGEEIVETTRDEKEQEEERTDCRASIAVQGQVREEKPTHGQYEDIAEEGKCSTYMSTEEQGGREKESEEMFISKEVLERGMNMFPMIIQKLATEKQPKVISMYDQIQKQDIGHLSTIVTDQDLEEAKTKEQEETAKDDLFQVQGWKIIEQEEATTEEQIKREVCDKLEKEHGLDQSLRVDGKKLEENIEWTQEEKLTDDEGRTCSMDHQEQEEKTIWKLQEELEDVEATQNEPMNTQVEGIKGKEEKEEEVTSQAEPEEEVGEEGAGEEEGTPQKKQGDLPNEEENEKTSLKESSDDNKGWKERGEENDAEEISQKHPGDAWEVAEERQEEEGQTSLIEQAVLLEKRVEEAEEDITQKQFRDLHKDEKEMKISWRYQSDLQENDQKTEDEEIFHLDQAESEMVNKEEESYKNKFGPVLDYAGDTKSWKELSNFQAETDHQTLQKESAANPKKEEEGSVSQMESGYLEGEVESGNKEVKTSQMNSNYPWEELGEEPIEGISHYEEEVKEEEPENSQNEQGVLHVNDGGEEAFQAEKGDLQEEYKNDVPYQKEQGSSQEGDSEKESSQEEPIDSQKKEIAEYVETSQEEQGGQTQKIDEGGENEKEISQKELSDLQENDAIIEKSEAKYEIELVDLQEMEQEEEMLQEEPDDTQDDEYEEMSEKKPDYKEQMIEKKDLFEEEASEIVQMNLYEEEEENASYQKEQSDLNEKVNSEEEREKEISQKEQDALNVYKVEEQRSQDEKIIPDEMQMEDREGETQKELDDQHNNTSEEKEELCQEKHLHLQQGEETVEEGATHQEELGIIKENQGKAEEDKKKVSQWESVDLQQEENEMFQGIIDTVMKDRLQRESEIEEAGEDVKPSRGEQGGQTQKIDEGGENEEEISKKEYSDQPENVANVEKSEAKSEIELADLQDMEQENKRLQEEPDDSQEEEYEGQSEKKLYYQQQMIEKKEEPEEEVSEMVQMNLHEEEEENVSYLKEQNDLNEKKENEEERVMEISQKEEDGLHVDKVEEQRSQDEKIIPDELQMEERERETQKAPDDQHKNTSEEKEELYQEKHLHLQEGEEAVEEGPTHHGELSIIKENQGKAEEDKKKISQWESSNLQHEENEMFQGIMDTVMEDRLQRESEIEEAGEDVVPFCEKQGGQTQKIDEGGENEEEISQKEHSDIQENDANIEKSEAKSEIELADLQGMEQENKRLQEEPDDSQEEEYEGLSKEKHDYQQQMIEKKDELEEEASKMIQINLHEEENVSYQNEKSDLNEENENKEERVIEISQKEQDDLLVDEVEEQRSQDEKIVPDEVQVKERGRETCQKKTDDQYQNKSEEKKELCQEKQEGEGIVEDGATHQEELGFVNENKGKTEEDKKTISQWESIDLQHEEKEMFQVTMDTVMKERLQREFEIEEAAENIDPSHEGQGGQTQKIDEGEENEEEISQKEHRDLQGNDANVEKLEAKSEIELDDLQGMEQEEIMLQGEPYNTQEEEYEGLSETKPNFQQQMTEKKEEPEEEVSEMVQVNLHEDEEENVSYLKNDLNEKQENEEERVIGISQKEQDGLHVDKVEEQRSQDEKIIPDEMQMEEREGETQKEPDDQHKKHLHLQAGEEAVEEGPTHHEELGIIKEIKSSAEEEKKKVSQWESVDLQHEENEMFHVIMDTVMKDRLQRESEIEEVGEDVEPSHEEQGGQTQKIDEAGENEVEISLQKHSDILENDANVEKSEAKCEIELVVLQGMEQEYKMEKEPDDSQEEEDAGLSKKKHDYQQQMTAKKEEPEEEASELVQMNLHEEENVSYPKEKSDLNEEENEKEKERVIEISQKEQDNLLVDKVEEQRSQDEKIVPDEVQVEEREGESCQKKADDQHQNKSEEKEELCQEKQQYMQVGEGIVEDGATDQEEQGIVNENDGKTEEDKKKISQCESADLQHEENVMDTDMKDRLQREFEIEEAAEDVEPSHEEQGGETQKIDEGGENEEEISQKEYSDLQENDGSVEKSETKSEIELADLQGIEQEEEMLLEEPYNTLEVEYEGMSEKKPDYEQKMIEKKEEPEEEYSEMVAMTLHKEEEENVSYQKEQSDLYENKEESVIEISQKEQDGLRMNKVEERSSQDEIIIPDEMQMGEREGETQKELDGQNQNVSEEKEELCQEKHVYLQAGERAVEEGATYQEELGIIKENKGKAEEEKKKVSQWDSVDLQHEENEMFQVIMETVMKDRLQREFGLEEETPKGEMSFRNTISDDERVEGEIPPRHTLSEEGQVKGKMSLNLTISESGRVEGETFQRYITSEEKRVEEELSLSHSISEERRIERGITRRLSISESGGAVGETQGGILLAEWEAEGESYLKKLEHPSQAQVEYEVEFRGGPDHLQQEEDGEEKITSIVPPYVTPQLTFEEEAIAAPEGHLPFPEASVEEDQLLLPMACLPPVKRDMIGPTEAVHPSQEGEGQISLSIQDHKNDGEQEVRLEQDMESPSDKLKEIYQNDIADGQEETDHLSPLLKSMEYPLINRENTQLTAQGDEPIQDQYKIEGASSTTCLKHSENVEETEAGEAHLHIKKEDDATLEPISTQIHVLPSDLGPEEQWGPAQPLHDRHSFKRKSIRQKQGKKEEFSHSQRREMESPPDDLKEKYQTDIADGQEKKDQLSLLKPVGYPLRNEEKTQLTDQGGEPLQDQYKIEGESSTTCLKDSENVEEAQTGEAHLHAEKEDDTTQKSTSTQIRVLPNILGPEEQWEPAQPLHDRHSFKRKSIRQKQGKKEEPTESSHSQEREIPVGEAVSVTLDKVDENEDETDALFRMGDVQTLDVSAQKDRVHLRRKVSVRRRQGLSLRPQSIREAPTETLEPADLFQPIGEAPIKQVEHAASMWPVRETGGESQSHAGSGEDLHPPPPVVQRKPLLLPGMVPMMMPGMMPGMVRPPRPQPAPPAVEDSAIEDSTTKKAEEIKPKKKLPGHAGFGFAHPQMMQELQFRLRKPKPQ